MHTAAWRGGPCGLFSLFGLFGRAGFVATALVLCASMAAHAADPLRPYSDVPLAATDFQMKAPDPLPVDGGIQLRAFISTGVGYTTTVPTCSNTSGAWVCIVGKVTYSANMDKSKSWIAEPASQSTLDHEQGHLDEAKAASDKAQAEANKKLKESQLKGQGTTREDAIADLVNKLNEISKRNLKVVEDANDDGKKDYDEDTAHGTDATKQAQARVRQHAALTLPSTDPTRQAGDQAQSRTNKSIVFDAALQRLRIDQNFIVAVQSPDPHFAGEPLDPVLGALVLMPTFTLLGQSVDGGFFFRAQGDNPLLQIVGANGLLFSADLAYLKYDPALNQFFGLTGGFESADNVSTFIDRMVEEMVLGAPSLFGVEFNPDLDFMDVSQGFTLDAHSAASNLEGLRLLNAVPEPPLLWLLAWAGAAACMVRRRQRPACG